MSNEGVDEHCIQYMIMSHFSLYLQVSDPGTSVCQNVTWTSNYSFS